MSLEIVIYFSLNFLITLIWWTIPTSINYYKLTKWKIPPNIRLWPLKEFHKNTIGVGDILFGTLVYTLILGGTLMMAGILIYKLGKCIINSKFIANILLTKEEKVQIALGTIERKNYGDN